MDDTELRIRVAELTGWFHIEIRKPGIDGRLCGYMKDADGNYLFGGGCSEIPRYNADLNAMREAEEQSTIFKSWRDTQRWMHFLALAVIGRPCESEPDRAFVLRATARQRAEAFVKTLENPS